MKQVNNCLIACKSPHLLFSYILLQAIDRFRLKNDLPTLVSHFYPLRGVRKEGERACIKSEKGNRPIVSCKNYFKEFIFNVSISTIFLKVKSLIFFTRRSKKNPAPRIEPGLHAWKPSVLSIRPRSHQ